VTDAIRRGIDNSGLDKVCRASQSAVTKSATIVTIPVTVAITSANAATRPARSGSRFRSSATYFVAVMPRPKPAKVPHIPIVDWTIANSPKLVFPSERAASTDVASPRQRPTAHPMSDHFMVVTNRECSFVFGCVLAPLVAVRSPHDRSLIGSTDSFECSLSGTTRPAALPRVDDPTR